MATAGGELTVTGAGELRVKESDRISALAAGFRAMGADIDEFPDGFHVRGRTRLTGGSPDAVGDHRLAMAFAIAGLAASGPDDRRAAPRPWTSRIPASSRRSPRSSVKTDKVYLVGFMGAGKSTLARALAARLDWRAEDIDARIEAREGRTIATIFAREGEPYFRSVERQVLVDLLPLRHAVVATGGGTFADPENRAADQSRRLLGLARRADRDARRPGAARRQASAGRGPGAVRSALRELAARRIVRPISASTPTAARSRPWPKNCSNNWKPDACAT